MLISPDGRLSTLTRQFGSSIAVVEYYGNSRSRRLPAGPCFTARYCRENSILLSYHSRHLA